MKMMSNIQYQGTVIGGLVLEIEQLKQENLELRMENELLHNMNRNQIELEILARNDNEEGGWSEEEFNMVANSYNIAENDFKFGGHDIKTI